MKINISCFKVVKTNTKKERWEKPKKEKLLLLIPKRRCKVFQELNISNVSVFLIDCQSYTFLLMNIIISDLFNHNYRIVQRKISVEKLDINSFTFNSFINK